jgi:hypothetical protein
MEDDLFDLLLQHGINTRLRAAVDMLSTGRDAEAARRKLVLLERRHRVAFQRFIKRWNPVSAPQ